MSSNIIYKSPEQIALIKESGKYLNELLLLTRQATQPGVSGIEVEEVAQQFVDKHGVRGAFKGFEGFPANLCISINDGIVHGIPDETVFQPGDLVKIDAGIVYQDAVSDAAISFVVGGATQNKKAWNLIEATKASLDAGLGEVVPGRSCFHYGKVVQSYIHNKGYSIIKNLTGHGVGTSVHEAPIIYNRPNGSMQQYGFEPGMVVALEPITALKSTAYTERKDTPWNLYTQKGDLGAQREYSLAITDDGYEILAGITDINQIK